MNTIKLNLGCGSRAFKGWINIDKSWNTYLYKTPHLKNILIRTLKSIGWITDAGLEHVINYPTDIQIKRCNVIKGLPFKNNSVDCIYTSHMLEHLKKDKLIFMLKECYRVLKPNGIIRVIIPDLKIYVEKYLSDKDADNFMDSLMLQNIGESKEVRPLFFRIMCSRHQWMYDFESMKKRLEFCGFENIKNCKKQESLIADILYIEGTEFHPKNVYTKSVYLESVKND